MWSSILLTLSSLVFALGGDKPSLSKDVSTNCRVAPVTERNGNPVTYKECGEIEQNTWDPINYRNRMLPGACRWKVGGTEGELSMCLCPADASTCTDTGRGACYWHKDSDTGATTCISVAERFYNQLARLLAKRGKKDFSLKIQYGAAPARGELPHGPYGAAHIGMGSNPQLPRMPTIPAVPGFSPYNPRYMLGGYKGQGYGAGYRQLPGYGINNKYGSSLYGPKPMYGTKVYGPKPGYGPVYGPKPGYGPSFGPNQVYGPSPSYGQSQGSWAETSYPPQPASHSPTQSVGYPLHPQPTGYLPQQPTGYLPPQPAQSQPYLPQAAQPRPAQPHSPQPTQPHLAHPDQLQPYPTQPHTLQPAFAAAASVSQG